MAPFPATLILTDRAARKALESKLSRFVREHGLEGLGESNADPKLERATHNALFDVWFPLDKLPMNPTQKEKLKPVASAVCDGMYKALSGSALGNLLLGLTFPSELPFYAALKASKDPAIVAFVTSVGGFGASALSYDMRVRVFSLFFQELFSPLATQYAQLLRDAYLSCIYDVPLGDSIADIVAPEIFLPDGQMEQWMKSNTPPIASSSLRYDASKGVITHVDGEIDYLVVGSGPAGSTIASGLQAAGKRVVLLERGPFVVWGSMDTMSYPSLMFQSTSIHLISA